MLRNKHYQERSSRADPDIAYQRRGQSTVYEGSSAPGTLRRLRLVGHGIAGNVPPRPFRPLTPPDPRVIPPPGSCGDAPSEEAGRGAGGGLEGALAEALAERLISTLLVAEGGPLASRLRGRGVADAKNPPRNAERAGGCA
eukprot:1189356-Prorocentrum_minimum.AAC.2